MKKVLDILNNVGAVLENDHFIYTSGRHGSKYVNKDALFIHPYETSKVARLFAISHRYLEIDVVVGPVLGGIILSHLTAYYLSKFKNTEILSVYAEKTPDNDLVLKRNYDEIVKDKRVLVVEDTTTTGGSIKKVVNAIENAGGKVIMASPILNRNPNLVKSETVGASFASLITLEMEDYDHDNCPLCKNNIPINRKIGHGKLLT